MSRDIQVYRNTYCMSTPSAAKDGLCGRIVLCHTTCTSIHPIQMLLSKVGYTVLIGGLEHTQTAWGCLSSNDLHDREEIPPSATLQSGSRLTSANFAHASTQIRQKLQGYYSSRTPSKSSGDASLSRLFVFARAAVKKK